MENPIWTAGRMLYYCINKTTQTVAPVEVQVCSEWEKGVGREFKQNDEGDMHKHLAFTPNKMACDDIGRGKAYSHVQLELL